MIPDKIPIVLFSISPAVINFCKHSLEPEFQLHVVSSEDVLCSTLRPLSGLFLIDYANFSSSGCFPSDGVVLLHGMSYPSEISVPEKYSLFCIPCDTDTFCAFVRRKAVQIDISPAYMVRNLTNIPEVPGFERLLGTSEAIRSVRKQLVKAADQDVPVLLLGESGTGKSLAAESLHYASKRRTRNFRVLNMAAISENLAESALFGTVPGAYTDAVRRSGVFSEADGGTLFMDEVGEMPLTLQSKLLRVIETGKFRSVGDDTEKKADVRLICATNANIEKLIQEKRFRQDLFYRINIFPVVIPPLRHRRSDIKIIAGNFVSEKGKALSPGALRVLENYSWPGNIRQLRNCLNKSCLLSSEAVLTEKSIIF